MSAGKRVEEHRFFCLNCGREGIPIQRRLSLRKENNHRKRLYCPWCKMEINHIECQTEFEIQDFKKHFENGEFIEEAQESLKHIQKEV